MLPLFTSVPYGDFEITSGAIQYGVPTSDFLLGISLLIWAQKPKSDSLIWNAKNNIVVHASYMVKSF